MKRAAKKHRMDQTSFEDFLKNKKIDPEGFRKGDEKTYKEWEILFLQVHPNSFVAQKLNYINSIRRKYHWNETQAADTKTAPGKAKPVMKPKLRK